MRPTCDFLLGVGDADVNGRLKALPADLPPLDRRFTQEEDFFLQLPRPFVIEPFEIHHDVRRHKPTAAYLAMLTSAVTQWSGQLPGLFQNLSWFFDPKDLFHPLFVQLIASKERRFLYLLRPDLTYRGGQSEVVDRGGNDVTPRYQTSRLFFEAEVLPLEALQAGPEGRELYLSKLFELTFQGESGRGYFVTGRWLDQEITKVLSKAALGPSARVFPLLPLRCRHQTLGVRVIHPGPEGRKRAAALLEAAWPVVAPWAERLQEGLRDDPYRDDHPLIAQLAAEFGGQFRQRWGSYQLEAYLSDKDRKEYRYRDA